MLLGQVVVAIILEEEHNLPLHRFAYFNNGWMGTCDINVVLGFRFVAEGIKGVVMTSAWQQTFGKIGCMGHPIKHVLGTAAPLPGRGFLNTREGKVVSLTTFATNNLTAVSFTVRHISFTVRLQASRLQY